MAKTKSVISVGALFSRVSRVPSPCLRWDLLERPTHRHLSPISFL